MSSASVSKSPSTSERLLKPISLVSMTCDAKESRVGKMISNFWAPLPHAMSAVSMSHLPTKPVPPVSKTREPLS